MADSAGDKPFPFERPPAPLVHRKAKIQLGMTNTLRFPGDLEHPDPGPWFVGGSPNPARKGNDVRFFVEGSVAIPEMCRAIDATGSRNTDYVLMINWFADPFLSVDGWGTLGDLLSKKLQANVQVRAMFWRNYANYLDWPLHSAQNEDMFNFLNRGWVERDGQLINYLPVQKTFPGSWKTMPHLGRGGAAILDSRLNRLSVNPFDPPAHPISPPQPAQYYVSVGSHHQKILCVKAGDSLVTFCGGIDFNPDRLRAVEETKGSPLHDVHCRIVGPASADLVKNFLQRWSDHPESKQLDLDAREGLRLLDPRNSVDLDPTAQPPAGRVSVQVGRTFGKGPLLVGLYGQSGAESHYSFAPQGEETARALISNAIANAKKFIYLEDQYFVSEEAARLLAQALSNGVAHVTIVLPHHKIGDLPGMMKYRRNAIKILRDADPSHERVRVFYKCGPGEKPGDWETYVHSKMTIIDDEFAVVGTVNYNRRSWHYDTEINIGVYDPSTDRILTNRFARWLRMRMWAEHLFGTVHPPSPPDGSIETWDAHYAEVFDGVAAGVHWLELIKLKKQWLAKNPTVAPEDYDQPDNSVATVRPYSVNDPPSEIPVPGGQIPIVGILPSLIIDSQYAWDHFFDPPAS
jgi:phosphatidylserine/phosphatidylglycerophosphate/cardiolipin synthase-like enzyme